MEIKKAIRYFQFRAQALMPAQNRGDFDREDLVQEALLKWVASGMQSVKMSSFAMHDFLRRQIHGRQNHIKPVLPTMVEFKDYGSDLKHEPSAEESAIHAQFIDNTVDTLSPKQINALKAKIDGTPLGDMTAQAARVRNKFGYGRSYAR